MLLKVVLGNQIRLFDCKQPLTLLHLQLFVKKTFPHLGSYSLYYFDEENDQIVIESDEDLSVFVESFDKKPKIHINKLELEASRVDKKQQIVAEKVEWFQPQKQEKKVQSQKLPDCKYKNYKQQISPTFERQQQQHLLIPDEPKNKCILNQAECSKCHEKFIANSVLEGSECEFFKLCQLCREHNSHKQLYPLLNVNNLNSKLVQFDSRQKQHMEQCKNLKEQKEEQLKFQSQSERRQLIVSYLQGLFGQQDYQSYCVFAKTSEDSTYQKVCESYLSWKIPQNEPSIFKKLVGWIGQKIEKQFDRLVCFSSD